MDFGSGRGADCCDARAPGLSHLFCRFRRAASGWAEFTTNSHSDDPISNVFGSIFEDMDLHWYFLHLFASISFFKFPLLNHMQKYRNTGPNCSRKIVVFFGVKDPSSRHSNQRVTAAVLQSPEVLLKLEILSRVCGEYHQMDIITIEYIRI